jgi:hypothetical protein
MGRVLRQDNIIGDSEKLQMRLKLKVIREHLGISEDALDSRSNDLLQLLPGLKARVLHLQSDLLAGLLSDTGQVAERMVRRITVQPMQPSVLSTRVAGMHGHACLACCECGGRARRWGGGGVCPSLLFIRSPPSL